MRCNLSDKNCTNALSLNLSDRGPIWLAQLLWRVWRVQHHTMPCDRLCIAYFGDLARSYDFGQI